MKVKLPVLMRKIRSPGEIIIPKEVVKTAIKRITPINISSSIAIVLEIVNIQVEMKAQFEAVAAPTFVCFPKSCTILYELHQESSLFGSISCSAFNKAMKASMKCDVH